MTGRGSVPSTGGPRLGPWIGQLPARQLRARGPVRSATTAPRPPPGSQLGRGLASLQESKARVAAWPEWKRETCRALDAQAEQACPPGGAYYGGPVPEPQPLPTPAGVEASGGQSSHTFDALEAYTKVWVATARADRTLTPLQCEARCRGARAQLEAYTRGLRSNIRRALGPGAGWCGAWAVIPWLARWLWLRPWPGVRFRRRACR